MSTPSVDGQAWLRLNRLLRSALPIRTLPELAAELAEAWRDLATAQVAIVSVLERDRQMLVGAYAGLRTATFGFEKHTTADTPWNLSLAMPDGFDVADPLPVDRDAMESVPFIHDNRPIGGAVLIPQSGSPLTSELFGDLAEISSRLCLQALAYSDVVHPNRADTISTDEPLRTAKLASLAEFSAGAGHEINNPLATIIGRAQLLLREERDPQRRRALTTIGGQAYRIRDMIGDLMEFARPPSPSPEDLNLSEACRRVVTTLEEEAAARNCRIELHAEPRVPIWADRHQLAVVISCLLKNSFDALKTGGLVQVTSQTASYRDRPAACLTVTDNGRTLTEEEREHLFDPFYSGRQAGRGLGFGLPKCFRIVGNHGGRIDIQSHSQPAPQTSFQVFWPASASERSSIPA